MELETIEEQIFLQPRLTGERFENHTIPLELFKDFSALEDLIIELAKYVYKQENQDRKRIPKGFTKNVSLKLSGVGQGSAIPKIVLDMNNQNNSNSFERYFNEARNLLLQGVSATESSSVNVTDYIPENCLNYFDRIGRSLREDEAMELDPNNSNSKAILNKNTRKKLLLSSSKLEEITEEIVLRGKIYEADQKEKIFTILSTDGLSLKAPMQRQHKDTILEAFTSYDKGVKVLVQCLGCFNRNDKLIRIETVEHISLLDANDVPSRIDELKYLKDGWLDGIGKAPTIDGLDWLSNQFDNYAIEDMPLPLVFPTQEGNAQMEWTFKTVDISLEIDLTTHNAELHILNLETEQESSKTLDFDNIESWNELAQLISNATAVQI
jgi:hypothetical protein